MIENEEDLPKFKPVTYEEVVRFFQKKGVAIRCEVCGQSEGWTVTASSMSGASNIDRYFGVVSVDSTGGIYAAGSMPLIFCSCKSCGYVRFHSASIVRNKFDSLESDKTTEQVPGGGV